MNRIAGWGLLLLFLCVSASVSGEAMGQGQSPILHRLRDMNMEEVSGQRFLAIQAAVAELERQQLKVENYRITALGDLDGGSVIFEPNDRPEGARESGEEWPVLSVWLGGDDLHVVRSESVPGEAKGQGQRQSLRGLRMLGRLNLEEISGRHFLAVRAALPELERQQLNVGHYLIRVVDNPTSFSVMFKNKDTPESWRGGSGGKWPDFSVSLSKDDLHVISSAFER